VRIGAGQAPAEHPAETLMIWTPGRAQIYGHPERPYNHTWIHCDGVFVRALLRRSRLPRNQPFSLRDPALMERHLLAIHEEIVRRAAPDPVIVRNLLENWLRETARTLQASAEAPGPPAALLAVRRLLELEYGQSFTLRELANRAHLSVPHFCAQFKRWFGVPAIDYLIRQRMHRAADLLGDRNLGVTEVGRRVGYEDLFYFSKLFKKHFGVSPRSFRRGGR
jgi:AraC family transcriptional regulator, arabinose operon regulatory protein